MAAGLSERGQTRDLWRLINAECSGSKHGAGMVENGDRDQDGERDNGNEYMHGMKATEMTTEEGD